MASLAERVTVVEKISKEVESRLKGESSGHDWWHTYRVYKNSLKIANSEIENFGGEVDLFIIEVSALLHDIADHKFGHSDDDRERIIREICVDLSEEEVSHVVDIVNSISFSKGGIPKSLEGRIVQDADRLDAIGAIGIGRTFAYGGAKGRVMYDPESTDKTHTIYHFYEKLLLLKNKMNTLSGTKFAEERNSFMEKFLEEFYKEWKGE